MQIKKVDRYILYFITKVKIKLQKYITLKITGIYNMLYLLNMT